MINRRLTVFNLKFLFQIDMHLGEVENSQIEFKESLANKIISALNNFAKD